MGMMHRSIFHITYLLVLIVELTKLAQYDTKTLISVGIFAAITGMLAVEYFFFANKNSLSNYVKEPNWPTAKKILFHSKPIKKEI